MQLILGGCFQGKLDFALQMTGLSRQEVADETMLDLWTEKPILNHLHRLVYELLKQGRHPETVLEHVLSRNPHAVILCDEIGCGVVPMDALERQYREMVGRICCALARQAERVIRVQCGIPVVLKGAAL